MYCKTCEIESTTKLSQMWCGWQKYNIIKFKVNSTELFNFIDTFLHMNNPAEIIGSSLCSLKTDINY